MKYFWYWKPEDLFPPVAIVRPEEFQDSDRLCIACTQTSLPAREQQALVRSWCDALPAMNSIRLLWFSSRVNQELFDAACQVPFLEGLYIKWSGIVDLERITQLKSLTYFHLGQSSKVESIDPLAACYNRCIRCDTSKPFIMHDGGMLKNSLKSIDSMLDLVRHVATSYETSFIHPAGISQLTRYIGKKMR